jgi:hypothetical protein
MQSQTAPSDQHGITPPANMRHLRRLLVGALAAAYASSVHSGIRSARMSSQQSALHASALLTPRGLRPHGALVDLIDRTNADILIPLLLRQGYGLGTVDVAETIDLKETVWHVHQVLSIPTGGRTYLV